jgi:hypothetical protein
MTPVSPDAERLMELAQAWVRDAVGYEHACMAGDAQPELDHYRTIRDAAETAFRKALFAQPEDAVGKPEMMDDRSPLAFLKGDQKP